MTSRAFQITAILVFFGSLLGLRAEGLPAAEKAKIEALLSHVSNLGDAKFIRNGKEYDAKSAATFLRRKWEANDKNINSAADFVTVAATQSSTTGKPYFIQFNGQSPTSCGGYLTARLKKMKAAK